MKSTYAVKISLPRKRIAVVDIDIDFVRAVLEFVKDRYEFEFTNATDAEYVFHSVQGYNVLKYTGIRIFVSGENVSPNFGISDYAMAFDRMEFGDRYVWLPFIRLCHEIYPVLHHPRPPIDKVIDSKTDFTAYVMSNTKNSARERIEIFDLLSAYKPVHSGGKWHNNVGGPVQDKIAFQSKYKFVIAFENCSYLGYLTEKLVEAAASNAIPIYWGDPTVASSFNPKAFIDCHAFSSLEQVVERVKEIDTNEGLYRQMLTEPWFRGGIEPECLRNKTFSDFLSNIFDQDHEKAYRRNRGRWGKKKERQLYEMWAKPYLHGIKRFRNRLRRSSIHFAKRKRKKYKK